MRRLVLLALCLGGLAPSGSTACELVFCPPVAGQPSDIYYYVLTNQVPGLTVRHEYVDTGTTAGMMFQDGTGPNKRVVHEFRSSVVRAVCQADRVAFENQNGVVRGPKIEGELFQVLQTANGVRAGTVFVDRGTAGIRATGGALALDRTYACPFGAGQQEPVLQKLALFHSALDVAGIDGAKLSTIEQEYLGLIRGRLIDRALAHMQSEGCTEILYEDFSAMVQAGTDCKLHYDNGDPGPGVYIQPSN